MSLQKKAFKEPLDALEAFLHEYGIADETLEGLRDVLKDGGFAGVARAAAAARLFELQRPQLEGGGLLAPLLRTEMPLAAVFSRMERTGICLDANLYAVSKKPLERRLEEVRLTRCHVLGNEILLQATARATTAPKCMSSNPSSRVAYMPSSRYL